MNSTLSPFFTLFHVKFNRRYSHTTSSKIFNASIPASPLSPSVQSLDWELDFFTRPILDDRGKKLWELLVTDSERSFVFSEFFRNDKINSVTLKASLEILLEGRRLARPNRCRFFRGQMQTIITRALTDMEIRPLPSRRCLNLMELLEERMGSVYKKQTGYFNEAKTDTKIELLPPQNL